MLSTPTKLAIAWAGTVYGQLEQRIETVLAAPVKANVWDGIFLHIKIADWLLTATLIYTVLQGSILLWEKVIKPLLRHRKIVALRQRKKVK